MRSLKMTFLLLLAGSIYGQDTQKMEQAYQKKDYKLVIEAGKQVLAEYPNDGMANHLTGRALAELKQFEEAKKHLEKATQNPAPEWMKAWSYGYLGLCHFATDNLEAAKRSLETAVQMYATQNATQYAEKRLDRFQLTEYFDNWEIVEKTNIRFHLQPGHGIADPEQYYEERELAYDTINTFFKATPYKKIDFYIWSKPEEGLMVTGKQIGFSDPDLCMINSRIEQTKGHELTHILCAYGIRPLLRNRLINEGVAVAFDQTERDRIALAQSANRDNLSIREIMEQADGLPDGLIYPVGGALIEFLREQGTAETLKQLLYEQTYAKLIELYGETLVRDFEQQIRFADGDKD